MHIFWTSQQRFAGHFESDADAIAHAKAQRGCLVVAIRAPDGNFIWTDGAQSIEQLNELFADVPNVPGPLDLM